MLVLIISINLTVFWYSFFYFSIVTGWMKLRLFSIMMIWTIHCDDWDMNTDTIMVTETITITFYFAHFLHLLWFCPFFTFMNMIWYGYCDEYGYGYVTITITTTFKTMFWFCQLLHLMFTILLYFNKCYKANKNHFKHTITSLPCYSYLYKNK